MNPDMEIPRHIGFIMDGNGRWARQRRLPRSAGHWAGFHHLPYVVDQCGDLGIDAVSVFAFSTENWKRPAGEVWFIMFLVRYFGPRLFRGFHKKGVRIIRTGNRAPLSQGVLRVFDDAEQLTRHNGPRILNIAFNYGGRDELVQAARELARRGTVPEAITESTLRQYLYGAELPDVDLVVRAGGEQRLSNFMLWQTAHACTYFARNSWPELSRSDIEGAVACYKRGLREREDATQLATSDVFA